MSKPIAGRTTQTNIDTLTQLFGRPGTGLARAIDGYLAMRPVILTQVKQIVDGNDIRLLASVLSGDSHNPSYMGSVDILVGKIQVARENTEDKRRDSDLTLLIDKVRDLDSLQCYFLQEELFRRLS